MRNILDIEADIKTSFDKVIVIINKEKELNPEDYEKQFEAAFEVENKFKAELKDVVIKNYQGYEKFSKEVLDSVYNTVLININEWCLSYSLLPSSFEQAMMVLELAYQDGVRSIVNKM